MKDVLVLKDLEEIKAISHPYRIEILEAFGESPLSAKQLSEILGEPHAKINYHIKTLLNANILELVEEKIKSGIIEKYYLPKAKIVLIDKSILRTHYKTDLDTERKECISLFEQINEDFYHGLESGIDTQNNLKYYEDIALSESDLKELVSTLENKIKEISSRGSDDKKTYNISFMNVVNHKKLVCSN